MTTAAANAMLGKSILTNKGVFVMFENKVILISVDGMRPDGFLNCGNP